VFVVIICVLQMLVGSRVATVAEMAIKERP
jgi:hypothetical protein